MPGKVGSVRPTSPSNALCHRVPRGLRHEIAGEGIAHSRAVRKALRAPRIIDLPKNHRPAERVRANLRAGVRVPREVGIEKPREVALLEIACGDGREAVEPEIIDVISFEICEKKCLVFPVVDSRDAHGAAQRVAFVVFAMAGVRIPQGLISQRCGRLTTRSAGSRTPNRAERSCRT